MTSNCPNTHYYNNQIDQRLNCRTHIWLDINYTDDKFAVGKYTDS